MSENLQSDGVSENGLLDKRAFERYKERTTTSKFKHQLFLGVGGATVFGLVGAVGSALLDIAGSGATAAVFMGLSAPVLATVGLGVLAVVGLGSIWLGSRFLSESILMDQDFQAKKIGAATRGQVPIAPTKPQQKAQTTPPGMSSAPADKAEDTAKDGADQKWADKFSPAAMAADWQTRAQQTAAPDAALQRP